MSKGALKWFCKGFNSVFGGYQIRFQTLIGYNIQVYIHIPNRMKKVDNWGFKELPLLNITKNLEHQKISSAKFLSMWLNPT